MCAIKDSEDIHLAVEMFTQTSAVKRCPRTELKPTGLPKWTLCVGTAVGYTKQGLEFTPL
jgi:hypothetical protein